MKVNDENSSVRVQDPDPNPDPNPLVRGMDPWIRNRIHTKMSWIRNTGYKIYEIRTIGYLLLGLAPFMRTRQERKEDDQREEKSAELPDIAATLRLIKERRSVMHKDMTGERVR